MGKHPKKQPKSVKIIKKAGASSQGAAVTPPPPQPEPLDQVTLQVQAEITQMKNAFYQVTGQTGATFEAVINNLYQKWFMGHKQNMMLTAEVKRLNALLPKTKEKKPEPEPAPPK